MASENKKVEIVVSGLSGRYPECLNVKEFREKILAGTWLVTHDEARWPKGTYGLPAGNAKIRQLEDFDHEFFGYTEEEADLFDPLDRILITEAHSAIMDAGIRPETLRGSNTGFFFGSFIDEVQSALMYEYDAKASVFQHHASRIHEALDLRGPACWLDNACATSLTAMQVAVNSIQNGLCDRALVGGVAINLDPGKIEWQRVYGTLAEDSTCHVFDEKAHGYVKAESAVIVFLQKKEDAKRIYAEVLATHVNIDGYKEDGFTFPGWRTQRDLIMAAMRKANINGNDFEYFEAHGTGTQAGDKTELRSIYEAVCRDRDRPLRVGSIKSICGHSEGASGLVSVSKISVAYQTKLLAPNLFYEVPNPNIPALTDGTYSVNTEAEHFEGGICGINNFGLGGGNGSLILNSYGDGNPKPEDGKICEPIPRLIITFGRNQNTLRQTMDEILEARPQITRGYLSLVNDLANSNPKIGWRARGYMILDENKDVYSDATSDVFVGDTNQRRPLWLVFSGIGSVWNPVAKQLMGVRHFGNSLCDSIKYLTSIGYDSDTLRDYLIRGREVPDEKVPVFVGVVVVQLALWDTLKALGVKPDGLIGHSVGEVSAAYADGCITKEEALQVVYLIEREFMRIRSIVPGTMLAVGVTWEEAKKYQFGTVDRACNNSAEMVTIAGRSDEMQKLAAELKAKNIFTAEVDTKQMMTHTPFLRISFERMMMQNFRKLWVHAKERSPRFISTSYRESEWNEELCRKPTAEYYGRNMLNPVYFYEALCKAPPNTMFLEVGPTGQLKSPILRSFDPSHNVKYLEMIKRKNTANVFVFLEALGTLYANGQDIELNILYPKVEYPVPRTTEFLSPIFRYDHSKPRFVPKFPEYFGKKDNSARTTYQETVALVDEKKYLQDHTVDGVTLYPATGYLYLAWKACANYYNQKDILRFPVEFRKVNISRATRLSEKETNFKCTYFPDTGSFAIEANNSLCTTGYVKPLDPAYKFMETPKVQEPGDRLVVGKHELYRELRVRGYHFGLNFQNVLKIYDDSSYSVVVWNENVITYLDALLQSSVLLHELRLLYVPTLIESLKINPQVMREKLYKSEEFDGLMVSDVHIDACTKLIHAAGVEVLNAQFRPIPRKLEEPPNAELVVESHERLTYDEKDGLRGDSETSDLVNQYLARCQLASDGKPVEIAEHEAKARVCGLLSLYLNPKQELSTLATELDLDLLHSTLISDRFFRTQFDVVMENISLYSKFHVLEVNTSCQLVHQKLTKIAGRPLLDFNIHNLIYTIAHPNQAELPEEVQTNESLEFIKFDLPKSCMPYRELHSQEFIIYRDPRISLHQINEKVDYDQLLRSFEMTLADNGFLLAFLRESVHPLEQPFTRFPPQTFNQEVEQFINYAGEAGLTYIGRKSDTFSCCSILFRKVQQVERKESIIEIFNDDLSWLEPLKAAIRDQSIEVIWIHSCDPMCGIAGLIRALAKDTPKKIKYIFYDKNAISFEKALNISRQTQLLQNAFVGDKPGNYRHITFLETPQMVDGVKEFEMRQIKTGDLSSFRPFVKQPASPVDYQSSGGKPFVLGPVDKEEKPILVDIHKAPLNFRDVMIASARMSPADVSSTMIWDNVVLGLEYAGKIRETGQRVMGFKNAGTLATSTLAYREFLWPVPDSWSLLQAATVPVVYATCYYGLITRCKLREGESVLIHAGTGGVGLAAINICLAMGCKVLTTAGTPEKREFLRRTYPKIDARCIGNSRDCSFYTMVMQQTNGRGVDIVLNSLTDDKFWASVRCLAEGGRFCEIGKYQFLNDDLMDSSLLLRNKTFHGVHVDRLFPDGPYRKLLSTKAIRERKEIWHLVNDGITSGVVRPLPYTVFNYDQVESAFRFMSTGKHMGKVVVEFVPENATVPRPVRAVPRSYFDPTKSYIITGGLGGMGLELIYWMQERGARNFVVTSRSGVKTIIHKWMIRMVEKLGNKVVVSTEDGGSYEGVRNIIRQSEELGPIGGVFLSTLVLANEAIDKITVPHYKPVMYAKSTQAIVFDKLFRELPYPVDYFVGFSSISSGRGFVGQTNYAFANSILERVCSQRRKDGLSGVGMQWGMIGDVGYVADVMEIHDRSFRGFKPQSIVSCWLHMDRMMTSGHGVTGSLVLVEQDVHHANLKISLLDNVCNVMGIKNKAKLDPKATLADLGLDSMMATEIGNIFENEFHMAMTAKDIRALTIEKISQGFTSE